jgi:hypothetical protein
VFKQLFVFRYFNFWESVEIKKSCRSRTFSVGFL